MAKLPVTTVLLLAYSLPLLSQGPLLLKDAVQAALQKHPSIEAAGAQVKAAGSRIEQARSGYLPRVNYSESWQRSNNPVFVFSSLLTQHQFTEQNFAIGRLNRPDALNNFQSQVAVDQLIWDFGQTRAQVESARLGRGIASEGQRRTQMEVIANVVRAYYGGVLAKQSLTVAREAVRSAEADLKRAETVRQAGMATDADVLAIRVHLSAMREQEIRRSYDLEIAAAALNEALGLPLDAKHDLATPLTVYADTGAPVEEREKEASESRPEARQLKLSAALVEQQTKSARSAFLPQISFRAAFEADRQEFVNKGGANWFAGASLRWNLFNGFADKQRIEEANQNMVRVRAEQRQIDSAVRLQVRSAYLDFEAAQERLKVTDAAVTEAEENLRIIKNRYEGGLTNVTELLRSETALLEARLRRLAAIHGQRLAAVAVDHAAGTLSADSEVLN